MSRGDPKQLILDAALATFAELGFGGATTAHILARAGISNGALFHHFRSKEAIAEALYLRGISYYQKGLIQALARHSGTSAARTTVKAAVHHHLAWVEAHRDLAWFMYERGRPDWQPAQGSAVRKLNRATAVHVRDWMAPLVAAGVIRDLPLTVLAALVNGPAHFVARRWLSGLITARPTSFADVLADAAWAAIAPYKARSSPPASIRISPAALVEAAALDAVRATFSFTAPGNWTVLHLTLNGSYQATASPSDSAKLQSIRAEGDRRIAMVDVDLLDAEASITARGQVVCLWRDAMMAPSHLEAETGARRQHAE